MKKTKWFTKQAGSGTNLQKPIKDNAVSDYSTSFLQRNEIKTCYCLYVSQHIFGILTKIVHIIIGKKHKKDVAVSGFIDTMMRKHLEQYKDEISDLYRKEINDLI
jgi:hypothetical protein